MWDLPISDSELRERLRDPDPRVRAQWAGRILREASVPEVWDYMTIADILRDWELISMHLGRRRAFWQWLLRGWRDDGLLPA